LPNLRGVIRRYLIGLALALAVATPAAADIIEKKHSVDQRIATLREKVQAANAREDALQREIDAASAQIRSLEQQVGDVSERLVPLERELALRELKLNRLNALFQVQSERLTFLRAQYRTAIERLNHRLVAAYEAETTDELAFVLSSQSFSDLLDGLAYIRTIADSDKRIAEEVGVAKRDVATARRRTRKARDSVHKQALIVAVRVNQVRDLRDALVSSKGRLEGARSRKKASLDSLTAQERADATEIDALLEVSSQLAAKIQAAQSHSRVQRTVSASGLIWPVSGAVTSPFGWRWGRMHEGIDIGVASGTPIAAAAAGSVIYAGWLGGYGNLTVVDHGGGLATAYGHQSRIAVGVGQAVSQGEIIGYVGSTGHSTGPHLHFEVRVNGQAVDPLGYL
jgi:murein DD-endopeptidase MepM/ murein hydrolase activator NlpD